MKWKKYLLPASIEEALEMLAEYQGQARVIAGGTDLIPQLKKRERKVECLVDISRLDELKGIELQGDVIRVGAGVTHQHLSSSDLIREKAAALAEGASAVGSPQIRYMGTVGGNIVNAQPAADTAIPLTALDAQAEIVGSQGTRLELLESLYVRPGESTVNASAEILVALRFRALDGNEGSSFGRLAKRRALSLPILNAAVVTTLNGDGTAFEDVRLALGPVALTPFRARKAEEALRGKAVEGEAVERALEVAAQEAQPRSNPLRASREYREEMVKVLLRRALERAVRAAEG
ncbi:MAG: molybdopterin dehydrogenase [Chloroflexi bacterium B3_Chlor]|nr:MAG: molybdopterin dehydrogenase [Chloroflexi bacterium B3_Chlor]